MPGEVPEVPVFQVGDEIEHRLMPGFRMVVLAARDCDADPLAGRPAGHRAYEVNDPEGSRDWVCAYDLQRPGEGLAWT